MNNKRILSLMIRLKAIVDKSFPFLWPTLLRSILIFVVKKLSKNHIKDFSLKTAEQPRAEQAAAEQAAAEQAAAKQSEPTVSAAIWLLPWVADHLVHYSLAGKSPVFRAWGRGLAATASTALTSSYLEMAPEQQVGFIGCAAIHSSIMEASPLLFARHSHSYLSHHLKSVCLQSAWFGITKNIAEKGWLGRAAQAQERDGYLGMDITDYGKQAAENARLAKNTVTSAFKKCFSC